MLLCMGKTKYKDYIYIITDYIKMTDICQYCIIHYQLQCVLYTVYNVVIAQTLKSLI